jgi:hypothetical protein
MNIPWNGSIGTEGHIYLGIDPGLNGAIALYYPDISLDRGLVHSMPTYKIGTKQQLNLQATKNILSDHRMHHCFIEAPHAMPKQGVTSSFNFGKVCGQLEGILACLEIPYTLIAPATWKRAMGLTSDKDATRQIASRLLPHLSHLWPLKKDHDKAEAMLLAYHAYRTLTKN